MPNCMVEGCNEPVDTVAAAVGTFAGEDVPIYVCPGHLFMLRRGGLDGLAPAGRLSIPPPTEPADAEAPVPASLGPAVRMRPEEFQKSGLLYLANRTLQPFGIALAVSINEDGSYQDGLTLIRTDDPAGLMFTEEQETEGRRKLAEWVRENWRP